METLAMIAFSPRKGYRPDIDGLRAIAVLAVVLYHLDAVRLSGGFVGVDVFFVISGYLIAGIVSRDIDAGRFTLAGFYERRIRRIVPALFVMLIGISAVAVYILLPNDLITYGSSLLAATFSYANYFFWFKGSYFADTYSWLLLHAWSLSVEEQFYFIFPMTLLLLKRRNKVRPVLLLAAVLSLAYSIWLVSRDPTAAFYDPLARAWELLVGCLLGLGRWRLPQSRGLAEVMSGLGLAMIAGAILFYTKSTVFPGASALVPCLGCGFLLLTGERGGTFAGKLLSTAPLVAVGRISYSVYLWHWPLIVLGRLEVIPGLTSHGAAKVLILFASLALGYFSWRFVEQPFRTRKVGQVERRRLFAGAAVGVILVTLVSGVLILEKGFPARFSSQAIEVASWLTKSQELEEHNALVLNRHLYSWSVEDHVSIDPARKNYLLIGDSHAAALRPGFADQMKGANVVMAAQANCEPLVDFYPNSPCGEMSRYIFEQMFQKHGFDGVLLTHRWTSKAEVDALGPTVAWFKARNLGLVLIGPVQEYEAPLPLLLAFAIRQDRPHLPNQRLSVRYQELDQLMQQKAAFWQVPYISMHQTFCPAGKCKEYVDAEHTIPTLYDEGHLTRPAADWAVEQWVQEGFFAAKRDPKLRVPSGALPQTDR